MQLSKIEHNTDKTAQGIRRFISGLSKKIILANTFGEITEMFIASGDKSVAFYWLFAVAYMLQVYFDFSGYSDMAIGLGKILGFEFMENFNYPFISASISEFWRRWHISLGSWFRDYVYIPMGGNRVKKLRFFINIFTVWFLTGFWHGAEWNFVVWGLYFGLLLTIEKFFLTDFLKSHKVFGHIYTFFFIAVSFVIFSGNSLTESLSYVGGLFGIGESRLISGELMYSIRNYGLVFLIGILGATPLPKKMVSGLKKMKWGGKIIDIIEIPILVLLLIVVTAYLADGSFNPFLYFRF